VPTRTQVCTSIAAAGLLLPSLAAGQDRTEREVVVLLAAGGLLLVMVIAQRMRLRPAAQ
jgi:hypothetical protein